MAEAGVARRATRGKRATAVPADDGVGERGPEDIGDHFILTTLGAPNSASFGLWTAWMRRQTTVQTTVKNNPRTAARPKRRRYLSDRGSEKKKAAEQMD